MADAFIFATKQFAEMESRFIKCHKLNFSRNRHCVAHATLTTKASTLHARKIKHMLYTLVDYCEM